MSFLKLDWECCFDFKNSQFPFLVWNVHIYYIPGKTLCTSQEKMEKSNVSLHR